MSILLLLLAIIAIALLAGRGEGRVILLYAIAGLLALICFALLRPWLGI